MMRTPLDLPIEQQFSQLVDVMHRLGPAAWKVVTLIARDDLMRHAEEHSPIGALRRDVFNVTGTDMGQPTGEEERAHLTVVEDPGARWTRLSLAAICGGVRDRAKRGVKNRGTGLAKSSAIEAIEEACRLGVLKRRRHKSQAGGDLPTSYSINWKRVAELAEESRRWLNVKTTNKFGRPLRQRDAVRGGDAGTPPET